MKQNDLEVAFERTRQELSKKIADNARLQEENAKLAREQLSQLEQIASLRARLADLLDENRILRDCHDSR